MSWIFLPFTAIGLVIVSLAIFYTAKEFIRALRQGYRIATAEARMRGRRYPTTREWRTRAAQDLGNQYSYIRIGPWRLPRNPGTKPKKAF